MIDNKEIYDFHHILANEYPPFLNDYLNCDILKRLSGVGLFCGIDYTSLYTPKYFYSRLDHSIAVALIVWNFTKDMKQTIAGLLHDVSSPAFSHVNDYRKDDYLVQESTEELNRTIIRSDIQLACLLKRDNLTYEEIEDYKQYPIADNKMPQLAADRLEYIFSTGLIVKKEWDLDFIKKVYDDLTIQQNEYNQLELGFKTFDLAVLYCQKSLKIARLYIENENKLALSLLSTIINEAIDLDIISEKDLYYFSEIQILDKLSLVDNEKIKELLIKFKTTTKVNISTVLPNSIFYVKVAVKKRYIDPIINGKRLSVISNEINQLITDFINFNENNYIYIEE